MPDVALISELSHHKMQVQKDTYPDMPHFVSPDEIPMMLRPSTRADTLRVHVLSLAVIADNEKDFREFLSMAKKRKAQIVSKLEGTSSVEQWKLARRNGAAKAGGDAKSEISEKKFWECFASIVDRWHLPSVKPNTNTLLLKEAKTTRNTVKSYLGHTRVQWQGFSDARRRRILKEKAPWKKQ
jgi:hypothetical protein